MQRIFAMYESHTHTHTHTHTPVSYTHLDVYKRQFTYYMSAYIKIIYTYWQWRNGIIYENLILYILWNSTFNHTCKLLYSGVLSWCELSYSLHLFIDKLFKTVLKTAIPSPFHPSMGFQRYHDSPVLGFLFQLFLSNW